MNKKDLIELQDLQNKIYNDYMDSVEDSIVVDYKDGYTKINEVRSMFDSDEEMIQWAKSLVDSIGK